MSDSDDDSSILKNNKRYISDSDSDDDQKKKKQKKKKIYNDDDDDDEKVVIHKIPVDLSLALTDNRINTFKSPLIWSKALKNLVFIHDPVADNLKGLHDVMRIAFFRQFSMDEVTKKLDRAKKKRIANGIQTPAQLYKELLKNNNYQEHDTNTRKYAPKGLHGGSLIDDHCNAVINQRAIEVSGKNEHYPSNKKERKILTKKPWNLSQTRIELIHPYARAVLIKLTKKGYVPICAQKGKITDIFTLFY